MERVETLLQKLQQQIAGKATPSQLLITVQMMQFELNALASGEPSDTLPAVTVSMPVEPLRVKAPLVEFDVEPVIENAEEKTVQVLQIDEAEMEAELEEIKRNADVMQKLSAHSKPQMLFQPFEDDLPPTLTQQVPVKRAAEINELIPKTSTSLNEVLKEPVTELTDKLLDIPVKDLKKAIGINDRYLYINELFRGDEAMYERSIKTINSFSIWPEAEYWIRRELKTKLGWVDSHETVKQFDNLIKRRFA